MDEQDRPILVSTMWHGFGEKHEQVDEGIMELRHRDLEGHRLQYQAACVLVMQGMALNSIIKITIPIAK